MNATEGLTLVAGVEAGGDGSITATGEALGAGMAGKAADDAAMSLIVAVCGVGG